MVVREWLSLPARWGARMPWSVSVRQEKPLVIYLTVTGYLVVVT